MEDYERILKFPGMSEKQARMDTTALLLAKFLDFNTGDRGPLERSMDDILHDPQRHGGVTLTLVNLVFQYATQSGLNPMGAKNLIDFLTKQIAKDSN